MILLRAYLLTGLVAHKLVWELLKRRARPEGAVRSASRSPAVLAVKAVKIAILLGLAVQTLVPDVLPILDDPGALRWLGAAVYTAGWLLAVLGRVQLGDNWTDIETPAVLGNHDVVARGVYRYIRHPIYVGDLMLLLGLELALNSWLVLGVVALAPVVLYRAVREETLLAAHLPGYPDYCRATKRFIPFVV